MRTLPGRLGLILALTLFYFAASRLGLYYASVNGTTSPLWPPSGIAIAFLWIFGPRVLPFIPIAVFCTTLIGDVPMTVVLGMTLSNTLEAVLSLWILRRWGFSGSFNETRDILIFLLGPVMFSPVAASVVGVGSLWLGGVIPSEAIPQVGFIFYSGNAVGCLVFAPFLLTLWPALKDRSWVQQLRLEFVLLLTSVAFVADFIFSHDRVHTYVIFPFITWAALRFGASGVSFATLAVSLSTLYRLVRGEPFIDAVAPMEKSLLIQGYTFVFSTTGYFLAMAVESQVRLQRLKLENEQRALTFGLLEQSINSSPVGFALLDRQGTYLKINEHLAMVNGRAVEEHLGRTVDEIMPPQFAAFARAQIETVFRTGEPIMDIPIEGASAQEPDKINSGTVGYYPVRHPATKEIFAVAVSFQDLTELKAALRARDEFIAVASHELKTPLAALKLQVQLQRRQLTRPETELERPKLERVLDVIDRQSNRLNRLVEDMLDISRLSTGKFELRKGPTELRTLIEETLQRHEQEFVEAEAPAPQLRASSEVVAHCDPFRLEQVIGNIISNALKYGEKGRIEVRLTEKHTEAWIEVQDQGPGIAAEDHERIFQRFERAGQTTARGLGLGLFICREIIRAHGGEIELESAPGEGSLFRVRLPLIA